MAVNRDGITSESFSYLLDCCLIGKAAKVARELKPRGVTAVLSPLIRWLNGEGQSRASRTATNILYYSRFLMIKGRPLFPESHNV
jgi:hypothetical protein